MVETLTKRVLIELPFTSSEITPDILDQAISKALSDLNKYYPKIVRSLSSIDESTGEYEMLRAYSDRFDMRSTEPYTEDFLLDYLPEFADLYYYSQKWTCQNIQGQDPAESFFMNLAIQYCGMYMANIRRSATMSNLPFDIKGDQFYEECKEKIDSLKTDIINNAPHML